MTKIFCRDVPATFYSKNCHGFDWISDSLQHLWKEFTFELLHTLQNITKFCIQVIREHKSSGLMEVDEPVSVGNHSRIL